MAVIVSSQISQNGSTLTGDTLMILVVKTDSGYAPNPGHAGTGVLVASPSNPGVPAQVCHSYNVTQGGGRLRPSPSRLRLGLEIIRMHRFQRLLSLLFMALALVLGPAGASASCPADATPDARAEGDVVSSYGQLPAGSGAIEGQVERSGIDPRRGGAGGKDPLAPVTGDPISIRDISGEVVAQAVTGQDGSFRVVLPAARYSVTEDILGTTQTLDVVDQMTSSVVLVLSVSR